MIWASGSAVCFGVFLTALPQAAADGRAWTLLDARIALVLIIMIWAGRGLWRLRPGRHSLLLSIPGLLLVAVTVLCTVAALVGIVLIVYGFGQYRANGYIEVWNPPVWTRHLALLLTLFAFIALASAPGTDIKVLATALGVGILIDATIVRALLVPALVSLLGQWNWWLPGWLARPRRRGHDRPGPSRWLSWASWRWCWP